MSFQLINNIPVWGEPIEGALLQIVNCAKTADYCALMADDQPRLCGADRCSDDR